MDAPSYGGTPGDGGPGATTRKVLQHRCLLRSSSIRINGGEESRRPLDSYTYVDASTRMPTFSTIRTSAQ